MASTGSGPEVKISKMIEMYNKYQAMEPLSAKFDRFLLGIDSRMPATIR